MRTILATLHSKYIHASLALPYLAAACGPECGEIGIVEFTIHEPKEQILAALLLDQPDNIAFSVYLWNRRETFALLDALHAARPELRLVVGGPEVSFEGAELFVRHPGLTALIRGEGEEPFAALLAAWGTGRGQSPHGDCPPVLAPPPPRTLLRTPTGVVEGPFTPPPLDLDRLPSPFAAGRVDLTRGLVYYETSRGCPYGCSFCMSALDATVRSFSQERIEADLQLLLDAEVPLIKFVDRTFNYDAKRARRIWAFLLKQNRSSRFHFEIGAHLLDPASLDLLASVPPDTFQFEIGVQSTLPATLAAVNRRADLERLEANVRRLRVADRIPLHLDLIYGLPEEGYDELLASLDRVAALDPHHLQLEPVKLLPGAPLRRDAHKFGIAFDPHPPYSVLATPLLDFNALERLRGISRLLDLLVNSGRFRHTLAILNEEHGSLSATLEMIEGWWRQEGLFRRPLSQREVFLQMGRYLRMKLPPPLVGGGQGEGAGQQVPLSPALPHRGGGSTNTACLLETLGRDLLLSERVTTENAPDFVDVALSAAETALIRSRMQAESARIHGQGIKLQHCAARFSRQPEPPGHHLRLYLYLTAPGQGLTVQELVLAPDSPAPRQLC